MQGFLEIELLQLSACFAGRRLSKPDAEPGLTPEHCWEGDEDKIEKKCLKLIKTCNLGEFHTMGQVPEALHLAAHTTVSTSHKLPPVGSC